MPGSVAFPRCWTGGSTTRHATAMGPRRRAAAATAFASICIIELIKGTSAAAPRATKATLTFPMDVKVITYAICMHAH
jgi:hypothetical protein